MPKRKKESDIESATGWDAGDLTDFERQLSRELEKAIPHLLDGADLATPINKLVQENVNAAVGGLFEVPGDPATAAIFEISPNGISVIVWEVYHFLIPWTAIGTAFGTKVEIKAAFERWLAEQDDSEEDTTDA